MLNFVLCCCLSVPIASSSPHLTIVQPDEKLIDQEVELVIDGLAPFEEIELQAEVQDQREMSWISHAHFQANAAGIVDIARTLPTADSSYASVDPMGLFWAMSPSSGDATASFKCQHDMCITKIRLLSGGHMMEQAEITRYLRSPNVQRIDVGENGLVGTLFIPPSAKPLPLIVTLSGSNGGLSENRAKLLASNGFAVFALGYFGVEGLPPNLQDIRLEYFEQAFAWLQQQPGIDASRIGLYGVSRGAELALILGSLFPDAISAIVAVVPSSVVYGGLSETPVHAWRYRDKPIAPFAPVPQTDCSDGRGQIFERPVSTRDSFLKGMEDEAAFAAAAILVENISAPLLLISGGDDQMWPSDIYVDQILRRLHVKGSQIEVQHLHYPHAGHGITVPGLPISEPTYYHPIGHLWFSMGGSRADDAEASRDAWIQIKRFFHESLKERPIQGREK